MKAAPPKDIIFILFGATGDLAIKKILPALENLFIQGEISSHSKIVAVSRRDWNDVDFHAFYKEHKQNQVQKISTGFNDRVTYTTVDIEAKAGYEALKNNIDNLKKDVPQAEIMIYLSLAPNYHASVSQALFEHGILKRGAVKLLIEKPFGTDERTAKNLDALITSFIDESDIYRVDHYLAKQAATEIMSKEKARIDIASIYVRLYEKKGIDGRGASYDGVGAFRDVGQNHMLEMLALSLAHPTDGDWQAARGDVIRRLVPPEKTCGDFRRGQYVGYQTEKGVVSGSETETAFRVVTMLDGITITLESGKKMKSGEASVTIVYKDGTEDIVDFRTGRDAYETVMSAAVAGSKRAFVGFKEVLALWDYADHVQRSWKEVPLEIYSETEPFLI